MICIRHRANPRSLHGPSSRRRALLCWRLLRSRLLGHARRKAAEIVQPADFLEDVEAEGFERDEHIFVGCRTGARSALAAEVLINAGFTNVRSVDGGIRAWSARGLPTEPFSG